MRLHVGEAGRAGQFVGVYGYLDDAGLSCAEGLQHGVAYVLRALHVEARASKQFRVLVVARVESVGPDVALVEGESLVGFFPSPSYRCS